MSLYNEDELETPTWVNHEFFAQVLRQCEKCENVQILSFESTPASIKGDHFASIMLRCKVNYRLGDNTNDLVKSLVLKTIPDEDGLKRKMLMESKAFETEIKMYSEALPQIEKILAECGEPTRLAAKIYYSSLEPHKVIVFEDLCESGFDTIRDRYLTESELIVVYSKLAKLHAVSYMLGHSDKPDIVTEFQEGVFSSSLALVVDMLNNGLRYFIDLLSHFEEFHIYLTKVKAMEGKVLQACKDLYNAYRLNDGKGDIFVLNHGDVHLKNLMFKFDKDNKLEDFIMVDYQMSVYGPSTIDSTYSQYMLMCPELRMKRHRIMQSYFSEFTRMLQKIKCPGELPKYDEFQEADLKYRHFAVFLIATFVPLISGIMGKSEEDLKEMDTTKFFENADGIASTYYLQPFVNDVRNFMPILLKEGYLD